MMVDDWDVERYVHVHSQGTFLLADLRFMKYLGVKVWQYISSCDSISHDIDFIVLSHIFWDSK